MASNFNMSSLYFYIFVVALAVLLLVTSGMRLRTYLRLRAQHREIEEAIRNGSWIPPEPAPWVDDISGLISRRGIDPDKIPKIWDVGLQLEDGGGSGKNERKWEAVTPFSLLRLPEPAPSVTADGTHLSPSTPELLQRPRRIPSLRSVWLEFNLLIGRHDHDSETFIASHIERSNRRHEEQQRRRQSREQRRWQTNPDPSLPSPALASLSADVIPMTPTTPRSASSVPTAPQPPIPTESMQMTVLIAMPTPAGAPSVATFIEKKRANPDEEENLPYLEVGVAEIAVPLGVVEEDLTSS